MNVFSVLVLDDNRDFQVSLNNLRNDPDVQVVFVDADLLTVVVKSVFVFSVSDSYFDDWVVLSSKCVRI